MAHKFTYTPAAYKVCLGDIALGTITLRVLSVGPDSQPTAYGVHVHHGGTYHVRVLCWYPTMDKAARALLREYRYQQRGMAKRDTMRAAGQPVMPETRS